VGDACSDNADPDQVSPDNLMRHIAASDRSSTNVLERLIANRVRVLYRKFVSAHRLPDLLVREPAMNVTVAANGKST